MAVTAIHDQGVAVLFQMVKRQSMRIDEIADMDVIANARSIPRGKVRAEYVEHRDSSQSSLTSPLDEMRRALGRLAGAAQDVAAGDVEITERNVAEIMGARRVLQHPFRHQLGASVRVDRRCARIFADGIGFGHAVDGGGGGEDEMLHALGDAGLDQIPGSDRVVGIVKERILDRIGHHDGPRKMDHRRNRVVVQQSPYQGPITNMALVEMRLRRH